jgi:serine protease AprX
VAEVDLTRRGSQNAPGDGYGHGTFVSAIAAGRAPGYAGASPGTPIVSLDVFDDEGNGTIGSVIAAADWIYRNHDAYDIRVANFSLTGSTESSFTSDPLDRAVEKLWLSGVVVVAAAGNYGTDGSPSGVLYAPANDPFVITVGAVDTAGTTIAADDTVAPWSAYGYTPDGFLKPDLGAPGRVLDASVPIDSTIWRDHPDHAIDANGHVWLSGTSFAAPIVAGAAAMLLAQHPGWTPDDVKGALMVSARPGADRSSFAFGVGEVRAQHAAAVAAPPNPNASLEQFLVTGDDGTPTFDASSWIQAAGSDASWSSASWSSASWSSASWSSASWSSASWSSGTAPDQGLPAGLETIWGP